MLLRTLLAGPEFTKTEQENELTLLDKFHGECPSDRHKDNVAVLSEAV